MKRTVIVLLVLIGAFALVATQANAEEFVFIPDPADLDDLDHSVAYTWGIDVSPLAGLVITEVELSFDNITNFDEGANVLWIHLLDSAPLGVQTIADGQDFVDEFQGDGPLIDEWHDTNGSGTTDDLSYLFSALGLVGTAQTYCGDGVLGFGIDPDCHYWNDGVMVTITAHSQSAVDETSWGRVKSLFR